MLTILWRDYRHEVKLSEIVSVHLKGSRPLLMHAANSIGQPKSTKTTSNYDPDEEAAKVLHKNKDGKISVPAFAVIMALKKAATEHKAAGRGKKTLKDFVLSGVRINDEFLPLEQQEYVVDARPAVVQRARIMRWRPRFDEWDLKFDIELIDPSVWNPSLLKTILIDTGKYVGLLDFRPFFGLFEVASAKCNGKDVR